jgi:hypothetical protein
MRGVILKLVRNRRMVITCCIGHTDLAFDKNVRVFKREGDGAFRERGFRVERMKGWDGLIPMRKTIIIVHE